MHIKQLLLKLVFVAFFLLLLLYLVGMQFATPLLQQQPPVELSQTQGRPLRIKIPALDVNAFVQHLGVTSEGKMAVPENIADVAWFKLGPQPGEKGSAVIAGHLNGAGGEDGVFANLKMLKAGDRIYIEDAQGVTTTFEVQESRTYDSLYADEVFTRSDRAYLNLITCEGVWNRNLQSYTERLVVFSEVID